MRYALLLLLLLFMVGCSEPVIDTSTDASMQSSIAKVEESLPDEKKEEFQKAIQYILFSQIDIKSVFANAFAGIQFDKKKLQDDMKKAINGKTGLQVIKEAKKIREQREEEKKQIDEANRKKDLLELKGLEKKYETAQKQKEKKQNFKVLTTSYSIKEYKYVNRRIAEMLVKVKNNTGNTISAVYFNAKIMSNGRSVPWEEGVLYDYIQGGIEPSEIKKLSLSPYGFMAGWTSKEIPSDAKLVVEVSNLFGADKKELYKYNFSTRDRKRLDELRKKLDNN